MPDSTACTRGHKQVKSRCKFPAMDCTGIIPPFPRRTSRNLPSHTHARVSRHQQLRIEKHQALRTEMRPSPPAPSPSAGVWAGTRASSIPVLSSSPVSLPPWASSLLPYSSHQIIKVRQSSGIRLEGYTGKQASTESHCQRLLCPVLVWKATEVLPSAHAHAIWIWTLHIRRGCHLGKQLPRGCHLWPCSA